MHEAQKNQEILIVESEGPIGNTNTYSFAPSDPENYTGPYYEGWEPGVSRDVSLYIRPKEHTILSGKISFQLLDNMI